MIRVCNLHQDKWPPGSGVYIGRPSVLGNPFRIGRDGKREVVIEKYRAWLAEKIAAKDPTVLDEINLLAARARTEDVTLLCYCKPLACHGDVIREEIEKRLTP